MNVFKNLVIARVFSVLAIGLADMVRRAWELNEYGATVRAEVIEMRGTKPGRRPKVSYRFQLSPGGPQYEHYDVLFSRTTGAHVSDEQWHAAHRDRTIDVRYWPHDPRVNAPAGGPPVNNSVVCPVLGFAFASFWGVAGWVLLVKSLRRRWRSPASDL